MQLNTTLYLAIFVNENFPGQTTDKFFPSIKSMINLFTPIKDYFEKYAFGVCTWLGGLLRMPTSVIRLFFIYASFLTVGSPLIIYMTLAFWLKMKNYVMNRRTSVWDL
jgi:phage shock protein PspC (stress-responsive transcriptional regulator)